MASTCFMSGMCGAGAQTKQKKPIENPVLAPFIEVAIKSANLAENAQAADIATALGGNGITYTVGNGQDGFAFVKSLQVGSSNGSGATIEIIDQEGGDFTTVFAKLTKLGTANDAMCQVRWGWISSSCGGAETGIQGTIQNPQQQPQAGQVTPWSNFLIKGISFDYSAGTVKYTLNCTDLIENCYDARVSFVFGEEGKPNTYITFVAAVQKVCDMIGCDVQFVQADGVTPIVFGTGNAANGFLDPDNGFKQVWRGNNRPVLGMFYEWLRPHVTKANRGIFVHWDATIGNNGGFIFQENGQAVGQQKAASTDTVVAIYIVNSGNCSPVISFKPQISATGILLGTGGTGGGARPNVVPNPGGAPGVVGPTDAQQGTSVLSPQLFSGPESLLRTGMSLAITPDRWENLGFMRKSLPHAYNAMFLNLVANQGWGNISAELKVQGDPSFSHPLRWANRRVQLIVVNPFQIGGTSCEWTNEVPCNNILSRDTWYIKGVFHDIHDGSYTTTLKLLLPAPSAQLPLIGAGVLAATGGAGVLAGNAAGQ